MLIDQAEDAVQEAPGAFDAFFTPLEVFFGRRGEERVEAAGVGAVFFGHVDGADHVAARLGHGDAALLDHALGEEPGDGLVVIDKTKIAHDFAPEARVEQVQDGVSDAADVLVDGKPIGDFCGIERSFVVVRIAVAIEIPRRIDEGIHRVGFAARGAAAFWTRSVDEFRSGRERRFAFAGEFWIRRQQDWQVFVRNGLQAVLGAINDGNRSAPITLARDAPVAKAKDNFAFAETFFLRVGGHFGDRVFRREAVEFIGIHKYAVFVFGERRGHSFFDEGLASARLNDNTNWQIVLAAKFEIALVVGGHGHDGSGAVFHQHEVADPDGDFFAAKGIGGVASGEEADFFGGGEVRGLNRSLAHLREMRFRFSAIWRDLR